MRLMRSPVAVSLLLTTALLVLYRVSVPSSGRASVGPRRWVSMAELHADCRRPCVADAAPRTCYFHFLVEASVTSDRDCHRCRHSKEACRCEPTRVAVTVNRQLPGPPIEVCEHDVVVVDVKNNVRGMETAIHWHGVRHQGTPFMDGVPMVTQCPIASGTSFRYVFRASDPGTHFYHAHEVSQHADGVFGALIVRQVPEKDVTSSMFDSDVEEHILVISPWTSTDLTFYAGFDSVPISSILINGAANSSNVRAKFWLKRRKVYRFRAISASSLNCPVLLSIDNHKFIIIAVDGAPVKFINVSSVLIYPGERYDFVLPTDQESGVYLLRVRGYHDCKGLHQEAQLVYGGTNGSHHHINKESSSDSEARPQDASSNSHLPACPPHVDCVPDLRALRPIPGLLWRPADFRVYLPFDVSFLLSPLPEPDFTYTYRQFPAYYPSSFSNREASLRLVRIANLSFTYPAWPLLSECERGAASLLCSQSEDAASCSRADPRFCECLHMVRLYLNSTVDFILIHQGGGDNESLVFHFHGNSVRVLGSGPLGQSHSMARVKDMDRKGQLTRNLMNPPSRDTVVVPSQSYVVARLAADNPGYWLLEARSSGAAMQMVLRVGDSQQMPALPHGFPRCGTFKGPEFLV